MRAYRAFDHFGATAFAFYSAFWAILGLEILQSTSIDLLHIGLLIVGVLHICLSPIVNGYYLVMLTTIGVASSLELALRLVFVDNDSSAMIRIIAAVSELCVVAVTGYGCLAAILHGVHERQVLPGFEDAVIETVLWKRNALKSPYSAGKYANPSPLGNICCFLAYMGIAMQSHGLFQSSALAIWFATFSVLSSAVCLLHNLRHERVWTISSLCDACLFIVLAIASQDENELGGEVMIAFSIVRLFIFWSAVIEELALMHIITFILQVGTLFIIGVASLFSKNNPTASTAYFVGYLTSVSAIYSGFAELANSVAQKELLPTGQSWKYKNDFETDVECGKVPRNDPIKRRDSLSNNSNHSTSSRGPLDVSLHRLLHKSSAAKMWKEYVNNNADENVDNEVNCPGDEKVMGNSDFQSPLFAMTIGIAIYSIVMSIGVFNSSNRTIFDATLVLLATQSASLLVALLRGQTSYGFLCFTYLLECMMLMNDYYSQESSLSLGMNIIVVLFQLMWIVTSFSVFRMLSIATFVHTGGLLCYAISVVVPGFRYVSGLLFTITFLCQLITLGILIGSNKFIFCRWVLQSSAAETDARCEMGFANNRAEFDRCVQILRDGGVCCIPTDTVYCLACTADSPEAIKKIYGIKNRPSEKPLSLWLGSLDDIRSAAPEGRGWTSKLFIFMESMWPGSVSLVVSRGEWLQRMGVGEAADLIGTEDSIALRVPNSTLTVALLKETGPLAITSANPSGACDCTHHNKVDNIIASKIDYILADGPSPMTIASSVIDVRNIDENELFFYRVGCVPESYVWKKLNNLKEKSPPLVADIQGANINVIQSFMSQIIGLVGCETYKIHMLINTPGEENDITTTSFDGLNSRLASAFLSGLSFYDDGNVLVGKEEGQSLGSEMITPLLNSHGEVFAVLQLCVKERGPQFVKEDLQYSAIVSVLLRDNLPVERMSEEEFDLNAYISVATLTEHGYKQR